MTLKVVIPKAKQVAANAALQAAGVDSYEEWATSVEGMLMERKAYVKEVRTRYKEFSKTNGAYIFHMEFIGTEGQLFNIFHTPGLVDALKLITSYCAWHEMYLPTKSASYFILYGDDGRMDVNLPPLAQATPRPGPAVPSAPARAEPVKEEVRLPFVEQMHRISPISVAPIKRLLVDTEDSVLAFDLTITYNVPRTNADQFEDWVASEWVHFYDAVPLKPNEKKFYDVKFLGGTGVRLSASFRTHVDKFVDIFTDEAVYYLREVAHVCDDETIHVQAPYVEGTDGVVKYEPILTHFVTVGKTNGFSWCFGGEGEVAPPLLPPVQVVQRVPSKAEQRYNELGRKSHELEEEVRQLKEQQAALQLQIAEKETRIRMFQFAQDELYDTMMM